MFDTGVSPSTAGARIHAAGEEKAGAAAGGPTAPSAAYPPPVPAAATGAAGVAGCWEAGGRDIGRSAMHRQPACLLLARRLPAQPSRAPGISFLLLPASCPHPTPPGAFDSGVSPGVAGSRIHAAGERKAAGASGKATGATLQGATAEVPVVVVSGCAASAAAVSVGVGCWGWRTSLQLHSCLHPAIARNELPGLTRAPLLCA